VLAKCVAIDWDAPASSPERAILTMLHRVPVLLHRLGKDDFDLYVPRSFAASLREWIVDAAREFVHGRSSPDIAHARKQPLETAPADR
jgi:sarcosine oxidase subunit gamma